jgi:hypothetical protein
VARKSVKPETRDDQRAGVSWLYDDLLAWLSPGGLLITAAALRFPEALAFLRAHAPELVLPAWFAGAYAVGLALSPLGRLVYSFAQAVVWKTLRQAWAPVIGFLAKRLKQTEGMEVPDASTMSTAQFHDLDRRIREYLEAMDPSSRPVLNRMKVLCSLACNTAAACMVFLALDVIAGNLPRWTLSFVLAWLLCFAVAMVAAVYRERRRQRTQLSVWRRLQVAEGRA